ncbi:MAG: hypothetical protein B7Y07_11685 [Halothiobacillus sp. 24-54-40]|jgi:hypothetical protein|nr:MAG: hypothetical protein B7Y58_10690 [Halothiobacillus sp. 35-54-62]OYZ85312.1 MAG: hypothetical protein B7Y07_11685 [Halothiobacillus sp. 24-54-40]OZA79065.1 MAG: hypothetical protein B7X64_11280 [Halothiobacillus sp. 39-53-45]HQS03959.1 hypothetical protein [Halothiobacillus sp.]HUN00931.1 hypothetical protein [Halothiobacillus sp.]
MADNDFIAETEDDESDWWNPDTFFWVPDSFVEDEYERLKSSNLSRDDLIQNLAESKYKSLKLHAFVERNSEVFRIAAEGVEDLILAFKEQDEDHLKLTKIRGEYADTRANMLAILAAYTGVKKYKKEKASNAANARHSKPDGARAKAEAIRGIWASGKYSSRDICAEQECAALGMPFSTARKALRNTPDPTKPLPSTA